MSEDDLKYIWAAYKKGALDDLNRFPPDMSPDDFNQIFAQYLGEFHTHWIFEAETERGVMPIGFGVALLSYGRLVFIGDMCWFPWAQKKLIVQSVLSFLNEARKDVTVFEFATDDSRPFFEHMCKYGVMRRVGKVEGFGHNGEQVTMFQTRGV